jgi:hypothetical protein
MADRVWVAAAMLLLELIFEADLPPEFGLVGRHGASGYSSLRRPAPAGNNHSNSKDRKRTSHALVSPVGGAGSAMLFSVAAAI